MLCQICENKLNFPCFFPCGHSTCCSACFNQQFANTKKRKRGQQCIYCNVCKFKITGAAKLPINYTLHDVLNENNLHTTDATLLADLCKEIPDEHAAKLVAQTLAYMKEKDIDISKLERCACNLPVLPRRAASGKWYVGCPRFSFDFENKCNHFRWLKK